MPAPEVRYYERSTGKVVAEPVYSGQFLPWAYGSRSGRCLMRSLFSRRYVSWLYGWINKRHWSRRKIVPFVQRMSLDLDELLRPIESFTSFNDFIIREIDLSRRPLVQDPRVCIAPADGRVLAFPQIFQNVAFPIKNTQFNLRSLLRDPFLAREYSGGAMVVLRLSLSDYHHFHFPVSGIAGAPIPIRGRYFAVTPYSERSPFSFYAENHRVLTPLASDHFGSALMIEVGAFTVGSIRQIFAPSRRVERGEHKGYFELGGSIVILLFKPGSVALDGDLSANTRAGLETRVLMGESLGRALSGQAVERAVPRGDLIN